MLVNDGNLIMIQEAAKKIKINKKIIQYQVDAGKVESQDGKISKIVCDKILEQKSSYVGIREFLKKYDNGRFDSKYARNREKYIDFLEYNDYFGIEIIDSEDILFEFPRRDEFYITKRDAEILECKSEHFFQEFGLTEQEKIQQIIDGTKDRSLTKKYIKEYLAYREVEGNIYGPSLTAFVRIIFDMPNIKEITDTDVLGVIENVDSLNVKKFLVEFLTRVAEKEVVKYHTVKLKDKEVNSPPAYSYEEYVALAKILFNEEYDKEHNLTLRALENSRYAEAWLYLSCHYVCGWRSAQICDNWIYPCLKSNDNPFGINIDTLKEDILNGRIPDETYAKIALYSLERIEMANIPAKKTGEGALEAEMFHDFRVGIGKRILIGEYHHIISGEGYMDSRRAATYRNWVKCKEFFGEEILLITGRQAISSRRLNKTFLQLVEKTAIASGHTALVAHMVAAYARNHKNINTTLIYLKDHGLTGETADVVLYMMLQRGVFGVHLYSALLAAYPDVFDKLTMREQTAIMEKIPITAYELETFGISLVASKRLEEQFSRGKTEEPIEILKAMLAVGLGKGKSKDEGIYCKKRALGYCCEHPHWEQCIANRCKYVVFTKDGIQSLINVIKYYLEKEKRTGNKKYGRILRNIIIPAFHEIINELLKEMSNEEKKVMKKMIGEALNE